jgi:hypothetical protein
MVEDISIKKLCKIYFIYEDGLIAYELNHYNEKDNISRIP